MQIKNKNNSSSPFISVFEKDESLLISELNSKDSNFSFIEFKEKLSKLNEKKRKMSYLELKNFIEQYDVDYLADCSRRGSVEAKKILLILDKLFTASELLDSKDFYSENKYIQVIQLISDVLKTDHSKCRFSLDKIELLLESAQKVIKKEGKNFSDLDQNARLCQIVLSISKDLKVAKDISKIHLEKYPSNKFFLFFASGINAFLSDYKTSLTRLNKALNIDSNFLEAIFSKASCLRCLKQNSEAIACYKSYIEKSHNVNKYFVEAYYGINNCLVELDSQNDALEYYNKGFKIEKSQLEFYLPYESKLKLFMETYESIASLSDKSKKSNTSKSDMKNNEIKKQISEKPLEPYLNQAFVNNPLRMELVIGFRKQYQTTKNMFKNLKDGQFIFKAPIEASKKTKLGYLFCLKPIFLNEIYFTKDHTLNGYVLEVSIVDVIFKMSSVLMLVKDAIYDFQRLAIYNLDKEIKELNTQFPFGGKLHIVNPYCRFAMDRKLLIRIDDPNTIFNIDEGSDLKVCRLCF